jgi:hypothetical protein
MVEPQGPRDRWEKDQIHRKSDEFTVVANRRRYQPNILGQHMKGTTMNKILSTSFVTCALASAAFGLAGTASAAPAGPSPVDGTISQLRAQGFNVIVSRVDSDAVDHCTLNAVRPGQTFLRTDSGVPGADDDIVETVTNKTVYVDVTC